MYPGPLAEYKAWTKNGVMTTEVRRAILECGNDPAVPLGTIYNSGGDNGYVLFAMCMRASGFNFLDGVDKHNSYDYDRWITYFCSEERNIYKVPRPMPACLPGAIPPERSVERRLNSRRCRYQLGIGRVEPECQP
jgi:hypothetical protein